MSATAPAPVLDRGALLRHGAFALPLAMAALPLYVHLPKLYGTELGVGLGMLGLVLLATRLVDAISDPIIGCWIDASRAVHRWVVVATPALAIGMVCLLMPPQASVPPQVSVPSAEALSASSLLSGGTLLLWLTFWLMFTYAAFSLATISYQAWGAQLSSDYNERTRVTAFREALALIGVLVAAVLPEAFGGAQARGFAAFAVVFVVLILLAAVLTVRFGPRARIQRRSFTLSLRAALGQTLTNSSFRWLLAVFVFSGIAAAIPSTLFLFFVEDVLQAPALAGVFLLLYFGSGALGMPLWLRLSRRYGKRRAWQIGMLFAVAAFGWAFTLGPGDVVAFGAVCVLSGVALGADLSLPASILADVIDRDPRGRGSAEGSYFGLWTFVTKANLALAAGIALPLVGVLGYRPGASAGALGLAFVYCLVPCAFKLLAAATLAFCPQTLGRADPLPSSRSAPT